MPSRRAFVAGTLAGAALSTLPASVSTQGRVQNSARRRRILVFDVNETMLDINALEPHFARAFDSAEYFHPVRNERSVGTSSCLRRLMPLPLHESHPRRHKLLKVRMRYDCPFASQVARSQRGGNSVE